MVMAFRGELMASGDRTSISPLTRGKYLYKKKSPGFGFWVQLQVVSCSTIGVEGRGGETSVPCPARNDFPRDVRRCRIGNYMRALGWACISVLEFARGKQSWILC